MSDKTIIYTGNARVLQYLARLLHALVIHFTFHSKINIFVLVIQVL